MSNLLSTGLELLTQGSAIADPISIALQDTAPVAIVWMAIPFFVGFSGYLLPKFHRYLALGIALISLAYELQQLWAPVPLTVQLLDQFGVTLLIDSLSGYFIVTNALVTAAVVLYCWQTGKSAFFYTQMIILHGSLNAVFICADFISLYVALEVIGIAAFLLIAYPRTNRSIWVALRYLFVSNTAMLFYLIGALLVYQSSHTFAFTGLQDAPTEAIALIMVGLLTKGGIFVSGLWLPLTHSEAETPVSALLSGIVVKAGVFPLVRCALMVETMGPLLGIFGVGTAILGVAYAVVETDTKRLLALSTISQIGFVLAAPAVAGFYALTHGLAKTTLFLISGNLPSRNFQTLRQTPLYAPLWATLAIACLSVAGFPLLAGFGAKVLTLKELEPWQAIALNLVAVGTAIALSKFLFLPVATQSKDAAPHAMPQSFWWAMILLLGSLVVANGLHLEVYTVAEMAKALLILGAGCLVHLVLVQRVVLKLPRMFERLDHLIGMMSLTLTALFWMVLT